MLFRSADISVGFADVIGEAGPASTITALRVRGATIADVADRLMGVLTVDYLDPRIDTVTVAGRTLTRISDGPYDPEGISEVLLPIGDTLWSISAREPTLTEIVAAIAGEAP